MLGSGFLPSNESAGFRANLTATLAAAMVLVFVGLGVFYHRENANVARGMAEQANIAKAMAAQLAQSRQELQAYANTPPAIAAIAAAVDPARQQLGSVVFDRLFIVDAALNRPLFQAPAHVGGAPDRRADYSLVAPAVAHRVAALAIAASRTASLAAPDDATASIAVQPADSGADFFMQDGSLFVATTVALEEPAQDGAFAAGHAIVGLQKIDQRFLGVLAAAAGTAPLSLAEADALDSPNASLALATSNPSAPAILLWQPQRPGDTFLIRFGMPLAVCAILIAGLLMYQARRAIAELKRSEARARKLAGFDLLSGLPNRFLFGQLLDQEFARADRGGGPFALLYLDIDRFKEINDTYGHDAGDAIIIGVTQRITSVLRAGDRLARFGGDEFAILQTEIAGPKDVEELASRIFEAMKQPINIGEEEVTARLSTGIALYPQDAAVRQDLMRNCDDALARAKVEGRNRYMFFQKRLGDDMRSRKTTEDELRKAIETGGLVVFYQPIMTVDGERMAAVEALVRWQHPVRGLVPPDHFISLAEDRGLILPLGEFVLRQACRDGKRWPGVRVAVNVSPIQFRQKDFAQMVERVLEEEKFDACQLELELTEGVVIADADQAENVMMDLRALGVRLALDDFGTGYSSLVYLRRFAFDKIKIDRSFLESMEPTGESAIIVHSIIHLGRALGLTVTAEGIETVEQHRFLEAAGVHELQGYLFSRPVPADTIDRLLANHATRGETPVSLRAVA